VAERRTSSRLTAWLTPNTRQASVSAACRYGSRSTQVLSFVDAMRIPDCRDYTV
jgi:hypothetical protein